MAAGRGRSPSLGRCLSSARGSSSRCSSAVLGALPCASPASLRLTCNAPLVFSARLKISEKIEISCSGQGQRQQQQLQLCCAGRLALCISCLTPPDVQQNTAFKSAEQRCLMLALRWLVLECLQEAAAAAAALMCWAPCPVRSLPHPS